MYPALSPKPMFDWDLPHARPPSTEIVPPSKTCVACQAETEDIHISVESEVSIVFFVLLQN
ncbi:hypothetical protein PHLCEN_2v12861 [Hermanssonia centrifuga]|uniref:Uncharacterized protein n=1 Tax=Hermanssonia centrifuga TaxID=98765 RepID=A0A2R6NFN9_9APHY|nr:hypothetical protein PHLCEN_2v12861 [Hermanssonia centrifuga]